VLRDKLVQHRPFGCSSSVTDQRPAGCAGPSFVKTARDHPHAPWNLRAVFGSRSIETFRVKPSDART
jgi:hypothetical protein